MTDLSQGGFRPDAPDFGGLLRQQPGLVEAPGVVPPPADGHKGHRVELSAQPLRLRLSQIAGKDSGPPGFFAPASAGFQAFPCGPPPKLIIFKRPCWLRQTYFSRPDFP